MQRTALLEPAPIADEIGLRRQAFAPGAPTLAVAGAP